MLVACAAKYVVPLTAHDPQEPEVKMKYHLHQVTQYIEESGAAAGTWVAQCRKSPRRQARRRLGVVGQKQPRTKIERVSVIVRGKVGAAYKWLFQ